MGEGGPSDTNNGEIMLLATYRKTEVFKMHISDAENRQGELAMENWFELFQNLNKKRHHNQADCVNVLSVCCWIESGLSRLLQSKSKDLSLLPMTSMIGEGQLLQDAF